MSDVRTVSDTKRAFYSHHARPISTVYRRVVEELLVEMHLLSVNADFVYDPIYALGIVTTFDRFMDGYRPPEDVSSVFNGLCQSVGSTPEQYRQDAVQLLSQTEGMTLEAFKTLLGSLDSAGTEGLGGVLKTIAGRDRFKYSRAFGVGFYSLLEKIDPDLVKDKEALMAVTQTFSGAISISFDKLQKDLELYRSNLDKMAQAQIVMADILAADRKKREERAQALAAKRAAPASETASEAKDAVPPVEEPTAGEAEQTESPK